MDTCCEEMKALLPWLANESLESAEKLTLLNHLAVCPDCRKELAVIINIRKAAVSTLNNELGKQAAADMFAQITDKAINRAVESDTRSLNPKSYMTKEIVENLAPLAIINTVFKGVKHIFGSQAAKINHSLKPVTESLRLYARLIEAEVGNAG